ncbi:MAG TPA: hypothetical protein VEV17_08610 [Bryobacteraceae bacterium]|nr:hypothetical protein [Bryobacteraceae bacterium]
MSKHWLRFVPVFLFATALVHAQDVTGDWMGTLNLPTGDMRLALHITKAENGLKATLDSVDQAVSVPVDSIQFDASRLTFTVKAFQASYDGKMDAAAATIEGEFGGASGSVPFVLRRGTFPKVEHKPAPPSDIDGDWSGTLAADGQEQTYLFHIKNTADGLIVAMDFPPQNIKGAEASSVTRSDSSIAMEWKAFGSRFEGAIAKDRSSIQGAVTQAGQSFPFTFHRAKP